MRDTWGACSFLLLTMATASSCRNAAHYVRDVKFEYSPSRTEDVFVLHTSTAPPILCEPDTSRQCHDSYDFKGDFCLSPPHGSSHFVCSFGGNATIGTNLELIENIFVIASVVGGRWIRVFRENKMYCTTNSQLPDEYFDVSVRRISNEPIVQCHFLDDSGRLYLRFPSYPTVTCYIGNESAGYQFSLPGLDDPFRCAFQVYSELPSADRTMERRLYQSLVSRLPARVDGSRPRLVCSSQAASNGTASFELQLNSGATYHCSFPDAAPTCLPSTPNTPQD